jgi:uncharacterized membrane protein
MIMNKEQILEAVREAVEHKVISEKDLAVFLQGTAQAHTDMGFTESATRQNDKTTSDRVVHKPESVLSWVLYGVGALIVCAGILVFVSEFWIGMSAFSKISVTLGTTLLTYMLGFFFFSKEEHSVLVQVLYTLSAAIAPVAGFVLLDQLGFNSTSFGSQNDPAVNSMIISGTALVLYGYALYATRKPMLHLILCGFWVWFYFAIIAELIKGSGIDFVGIKDITAYASMVLAIGLFSYANFIASNNKTKPVVSLLTFVSFSLFLSAGLFLGGVWNLLYAFLLCGTIFLAVQIKRISALVLSAVALVIYLVKISSLYFADSLGFAVVLILTGFFVIAVGYLTYYLNKKYILSL